MFPALVGSVVLLRQPVPPSRTRVYRVAYPEALRLRGVEGYVFISHVMFICEFIGNIIGSLAVWECYLAYPCSPRSPLCVP